MNENEKTFFQVMVGWGVVIFIIIMMSGCSVNVYITKREPKLEAKEVVELPVKKCEWIWDTIPGQSTLSGQPREVCK